MKKIILFFLILFVAEANAEIFSFQEAYLRYEKSNLKLSTADKDGRIPTLNQKGAASPQIDEASREFLKNINNKTVLEIGAAYGKILKEAVDKKVKFYAANDLDERHLLIAAKNIVDPKASLIEFCSGDFVDNCKYEDNKFDKILAARVFHFFNPEKLEKTALEIKKILKPHGRIYIVAITPYVRRYQSFIPIFEECLKKGDKYPGYVDSLYDYADKETTTQKDLDNIRKEEFMFLTPEVLSNIFKDLGFKIITSKMVPLQYASEAWQLDGRENVVFIAEKI